MDRDNKLLNHFCSGVLALGGMYAFNKAYDIFAVHKNKLKTSAEHIFSWKGVNVYYERHGKGTPMLLLHALHPAASAYEWNRVVDQLAKDHTVYILDLPGCGRSDKPHILYTNFFYVQLIIDFVQTMSLTSVTLVASNLTCSVAVMAAAYEKERIHALTLINPPSLHSLAETPDFISRCKYRILSMPVFGAFIYHILASRPQIDMYFSEKYFFNPFHENDELVDTYFESAHLGQGGAHYFAASLLGKYLNTDIRFVLPRLQLPVKLIEGSAIEEAEQIIEEWHKVLPAIQVEKIEHTKQLPMLEEPEKTAAGILS